MFSRNLSARAITRMSSRRRSKHCVLFGDATKFLKLVAFAPATGRQSNHDSLAQFKTATRSKTSGQATRSRRKFWSRKNQRQRSQRPESPLGGKHSTRLRGRANAAHPSSTQTRL